jgi:hypothetical protein
VIAAMEDAIAKAARPRYGSETDVHAEIDAEDRRAAAVAPHAGGREVENDSNQISAGRTRARAIRRAQVGDTIADTLPPLEYGRIAAQSAKQVIVQKVREAERDRQYEEFKDRIGEIVNGVVKRVEYGNVVVDLGRGEAIIRRDEMLPRETCSATATASAPISMTCAASRAARRSSCRAPIRSSWRSCSRRKCRKSTTASSRSRRWPAIPARAPRSA